MKAEYCGNADCLWRDSVEREGQEGAHSTNLSEGTEKDGAAITNKRLAAAGYFDILDCCKSLHLSD